MARPNEILRGYANDIVGLDVWLLGRATTEATVFRDADHVTFRPEEGEDFAAMVNRACDFAEAHDGRGMVAIMQPEGEPVAMVLIASPDDGCESFEINTTRRTEIN